MAYKTVAIAGATGNLGPSILKALVEGGFQVTVLSRSSSVPDLPSGVKVVQVDYKSQSSLVSALKGQDAFVSVVPNHGDQPFLIDAAIAAGVKRFIPSEFGSNVWGNDKTRAIPAFEGKTKTQEYLRQKESQISYTVVVNGVFLDWGLQAGMVVNFKGTSRIFDGGDKVCSMTNLADIGKAVAGVLHHPEDTKNRAVYVQSAAVSQNQLLKLAQKVKPDFKPQTEQVDTAVLMKEGLEEIKKENPDIMKAIVGPIQVTIFAEGYGNLWEKNDNDLLGVKQLSETELEELVAKYV